MPPRPSRASFVATCVEAWKTGDRLPYVITERDSTVAIGMLEARMQGTAVDIENIPSQRALEKSGFNREGRLERYTVFPILSADPRACFMYARCR